MLLAKLKDKLFNNRNSVEVESLEGDLNGISLQDCLEWTELMREKVFFDEEEDVVVVDYGVLFTDYVMIVGGLVHVTDEDGTHLFPSGKVPSIWSSSSTFDHIGNIDFDKVKDGDIIYARNDENTSYYCGIVEEYQANNSFRIKVLYSSKVTFYYYTKQDDAWDYSSQSDNTFGGTKLYKLGCKINNESEKFYFIVTDSNNGVFVNTSFNELFFPPTSNPIPLGNYFSNITLQGNHSSGGAIGYEVYQLNTATGVYERKQLSTVTNITVVPL